jgi:hypothetical protein
MTQDRVAIITQGMLVDVWCKSNQHWSPGFRVIAADADGVRVARVSDGQELPVAFPDADVRPTDTAHHQPGMRRPL